MSRRLQVLMDEQEYLEILNVARRRGLTVSEWTRQALRMELAGQRETVEYKLQAIADASLHRFPTADIEVLLREIEAGHTLMRS